MENLADLGTVWKWSGVAFWFCFIEQKSVGVERPIFKTMTDCFIVQNCFKAESRGFTLWQDKPQFYRGGGRIFDSADILLGQRKY